MQASKKFLSTPSARRATNSRTNGQTHVDISIHALCEEGDRSPRFRLHKPTDFYPRPLRGGRPNPWPWFCRSNPFLSTPSARRATPPRVKGRKAKNISIHALCEEGDPFPRPPLGGTGISIHALCEEGDLIPPPLFPLSSHFYPRPLRGGRQAAPGRTIIWRCISIHALCEEGDRKPPSPSAVSS